MQYKSSIKKYFKNFQKLLDIKDYNLNKINDICHLLKKLQKTKKKVFIFGNGGSASIASHVSVDLIKIAKIKCINFNEANLITCFSNDYGYENWMKKSLEVHAEKNDVLIIISSSGESQNVINLANQGKKMGLKKIITLTGFKKSNRLRKKGDINIWIDSKRYNFVENTHQLILLSIVDLISKT